MTGGGAEKREKQGGIHPTPLRNDENVVEKNKLK
tara:strand:- start:383 stop:484 length:102 start_codon:yes stop_codon:yes gene_type:complete